MAAHMPACYAVDLMVWSFPTTALHGADGSCCMRALRLSLQASISSLQQALAPLLDFCGGTS